MCHHDTFIDRHYLICLVLKLHPRVSKAKEILAVLYFKMTWGLLEHLVLSGANQHESQGPPANIWGYQSVSQRHYQLRQHTTSETVASATDGHRHPNTSRHTSHSSRREHDKPNNTTAIKDSSNVCS